MSQKESRNIEEALKDTDWVNVMQEELVQFQRNKVWHLVPRPTYKSVTGTTWVFRNKLDEQDNVIRNKARLVVK